MRRWLYNWISERTYPQEAELISQVSGNTRGIKPVLLKALERTYRRRVPPKQVVSVELARHLTEVSAQMGRQVGVLLTRDGSVRNVIVGDPHQLEIPEIGRLRGGPGRFRGLRLVHTHLNQEPLSRDDLNDLALLRLDLVAMVGVNEKGLPGRVEVAHVLPSDDPSNDPFRRIEASELAQLHFDFDASIRALEREFTRLASNSRKQGFQERVMAVGITDDDRFQELLELAGSAGLDVAFSLQQRRSRPHPKTVVGKGKLGEIVLEGMRRQVGIAIFDVDLKPAQARAFEDATGLRAVDRTQLIMDIFAQRARSRDGKIQVELAQLRYSLPRLTEKDAGLSRLSGGIGGRGPGETVMEIGRRRVRDRIRKLESEVSKLARQRDLRRRRRRKFATPVVSIIGYTNVGKTTLLNALTESSVRAADQLFVTLDPTSRRLRFPEEGEVIITDTVGFLKDLPADLMAAFRATLEELEDADVLLHVVDVSDPAFESRLAAVQDILKDLDLFETPTVLVLNKADRMDPQQVENLARRFRGIPVSAARKEGLEQVILNAEVLLQQSVRRVS